MHSRAQLVAFCILLISTLFGGITAAQASPPPTITSVDPSSALVGTTLDITVTGQDFLDGAILELGPNTTQNGSTFINSSTIIFNVTIDEVADPGPRDVVIVNPDLQSATLGNGFELIPTSRHYMDPLGSATFPYTTRFTAAHSLAQVLTAAGRGDSILVSSDTWSVTDTHIEKSVQIYGAWNSDFSSRDVVSAKSVMQVSPNLLVSEDVVLDGFVFEGGVGRRDIGPPVNAVMGGAITVLQSELTVANCEFRNNSAQSDDAGNGGGAIFIKQGTLNVSSSDFHDNLASNGGAIYMYSSSGQFSNNSFTNNVVDAGALSAFGGAVYLTSCLDVTLEDNVFGSNTGAVKGGAIYAGSPISVAVSGGSLSNSDVSLEGGAIYSYGGEVSIEDVLFDSCSATVDGGAVRLDHPVSVAISGSSFLGCTTGQGGTVTIDHGMTNINHNLFSGNDGLVSALMLIDITGGNVLGNTIADNLGLGPALLFFNSSVEARNNIVANNAGIGISCGGAALPTLLYNDVFASTGGDYVGCAPGEGSISADPIFVDAPGGDYHLGLHSPAIDAGDPSDLFVDPDGGRGDMGWYGSHSFVTEVPSTPQVVTVQTVSGDIVVDWAPNPEGDIAQYVVYGSPVADFTPNAALVRAIVAAPATTANLGPAAADAYFKLCAVDNDGYSSGFSVAQQAVPVEADIPGYVTRLLGNRPNPFNPSTLIQYEVASRGRVRLHIYDVAGRLVRRLVETELDPGRYESVWNGRNEAGATVASGSYFYRLVTAGESHRGKMILVK